MALQQLSDEQIRQWNRAQKMNGGSTTFTVQTWRS